MHDQTMEYLALTKSNFLMLIWFPLVPLHKQEYLRLCQTFAEIVNMMQQYFDVTEKMKQIKRSRKDTFQFN